MSFLNKFTDNLRSARTDAGLTQRQLAQQIGVSTNCISMYETGKRTPNIKTVSVIANVLHVSLDELIPAIESDDVPYAVPTVIPGQSVIFDLLGEESV